MKQIPRETIVFGKAGIKYKGVLNAGIDAIFKSDLNVLNNPYKLLSDILVEEQGMVTIDSRFKSINIGDVSDDYRYLGGKTKCAKFIKKFLEYTPKDIYVNRTICKEYNLSDISDAVFAPSHQIVEY